MSTGDLVFKEVQTPLGLLKLVASGDGLMAVLWEADDPRRVRLPDLVYAGTHPMLEAVERQLNEYFDGTRRAFDVPLAPRGTPFQLAVWTALLSIPCGQTRSYGQIARDLGNPAATRAVGAANGRNPISIIAPCHRVIGASGALTGFAGGLAAKRHLLALEARGVGRQSVLDL